jgi:hypothetical protein
MNIASRKLTRLAIDKIKQNAFSLGFANFSTYSNELFHASNRIFLKRMSSCFQFISFSFWSADKFIDSVFSLLFFRLIYFAAISL